LVKVYLFNARLDNIPGWHPIGDTCFLANHLLKFPELSYQAPGQFLVALIRAGHLPALAIDFLADKTYHDLTLLTTDG